MGFVVLWFCGIFFSVPWKNGRNAFTCKKYQKKVEAGEKKNIFEALGIADIAIDALREHDLAFLEKLDMPELSLAAAAFPLCQEDREKLIERVHFGA